MEQKIIFHSLLIMLIFFKTNPSSITLNNTTNNTLSVEEILSEWTQDQFTNVTRSLPHIIGPESPITQDIVNTIEIKKIPLGIDMSENRYWEKLTNWYELFHPDKLTVILQATKNILTSKTSHVGPIYANTFFRRAYKFTDKDNIYAVGDLHGGGIHTIADIIQKKLDQNLKIKNKNDHFVFLGDMVDGGLYSIETLFFVTLLFLKNQNNIHIIRGNHEDIDLNENYGFTEEILKKYNSLYPNLEELGVGVEKIITNSIRPFYEQLPVVLFGIFPDSKLILPFCHGGIDLQDQEGAKKFLETSSDFMDQVNLDQVNLKEYWEAYETHTITNPYQWNDYAVNETDKTSYSPRDNYQGTILTLGKEDTEKWFNAVCPSGYTLPYMLRAHQHSIKMEELMPLFFLYSYIAALWGYNPRVFTLCVSFGSGFSLTTDKFPGIMNTTTAVLKNSGKILEVIRHKNNNLDKQILQQHRKKFSQWLMLELENSDNYKSPLFYALVKYYKDNTREKTSHPHLPLTIHLLQQFLRYMVRIEKDEIAATYSFNGKDMELTHFNLPQSFIKKYKIPHQGIVSREMMINFYNSMLEKFKEFKEQESNSVESSEESIQQPVKTYGQTIKKVCLYATIPLVILIFMYQPYKTDLALRGLR